MDATEKSLIQLQELLVEFENTDSNDLRKRVCSLIPVFDSLRSMGKTLIPNGLKLSASERILSYFKMYPNVILHEKELAIVAGISEWARRIRELRVQFGWKIITGMTVRQMAAEGELSSEVEELGALSPNDYCLIDLQQDRDAAHRWNVANDIRKGPGGSRERILKYLRSNVGKVVTGEELSYVAQSSEWARRTRELRTEDGWPISTKMSGNPSLTMYEYVLEEDRQAPAHDRHISLATRSATLRRDGYKCQKCGWSHDEWNKSDPRFLELHHVEHHVDGGSNEMENLITYCNVCHDAIHKVDNRR